MTQDVRTDSADAAQQPIAPSNPDAPVRIDVAMPRGLYDRLTDHDEAPRSRYDMATGRADGRFAASSICSIVLPGLDRQALGRLPASRTPRDASRRARNIARGGCQAMLGADHRDPIDQR